MTIVLITAGFSFALALILGVTLGFFREFFAVAEDPMVSNIREALPGANCGACGFPGCDNYAAAVAAGNAPVNACLVGGAAVAEKVSAITGISGSAVLSVVSVLACQGSKALAGFKGQYTGITSCRGAKLSTGSIKLCSWGCQGFGDCVSVCKFGALKMGDKGLPVVDHEKCTGCRLCINECPQGLLKAVPKDQKGAMPLCSNRNPVKQMVAKTCKAGCIKCGICVKNCPHQCINLDTHIPVVDLSKCDSCGTCVEKCPTKVFKLIEKDILI